jgi:hypothetical protein
MIAMLWAFLWKWALLAGLAYLVFLLAAWHNARKDRPLQRELGVAFRRQAAANQEQLEARSPAKVLRLRGAP